MKEVLPQLRKEGVGEGGREGEREGEGGERKRGDGEKKSSQLHVHSKWAHVGTVGLKNRGSWSGPRKSSTRICDNWLVVRRITLRERGGRGEGVMV